MDIKPLSSGELARESRVNVETVRYYERRGLLPHPPRGAGGFRQYAPDAVRRIRFIKRAQELGFTLKEIAELLSLRVEPDTTCATVKQRAGAKIRQIEAKVRELEGMKLALQKLRATCREAAPVSQCPLLDALEAQESEPCQNLTPKGVHHER